MTVLRYMSPPAKEQIMQKLADFVAQRSEISFACIHGSFLEPQRPFRDIDLGVWLRPKCLAGVDALDYGWSLASCMEKKVPHPIDVRLLNRASLGFRYAASGGRILYARDEVEWYDFREGTWLAYWDFEPLARQMLFDILRPAPK